MELGAYLRFLKQYVDSKETATLIDTELTDFRLPGGHGMSSITGTEDDKVMAFSIMPVAYNITGTPREEVTLEDCISKLEEFVNKELNLEEQQEAAMLAYVIATSLEKGTRFAEEAKKSGNNLLFTKRSKPDWDVTEYVTPQDFANKFLEAAPISSPFGGLSPQMTFWFKQAVNLYQDAHKGDLSARPPLYKLEAQIFIPTFEMVEKFAAGNRNLEHSLPTPVQATFDLSKPYQQIRHESSG